MWELEYKESWAPKNWCLWTVVLEKTLQSPLDCKEIQPVILKEISPECSLEGLMLKLKLQQFGHLDERSWLIWKDPDAVKDWRQEEHGMTEDKMVGWHHWLNGHEFGWTAGVADGQGGWCAVVHGVVKSQTRLSDWHELIITTQLQCNIHFLQVQMYLSTELKNLDNSQNIEII